MVWRIIFFESMTLTYDKKLLEGLNVFINFKLNLLAQLDHVGAVAKTGCAWTAQLAIRNNLLVPVKYL